MPVHPDVIAADKAPKGLENVAPEHYREASNMAKDASGSLVITLSESVKSALWPRLTEAPKEIQRITSYLRTVRRFRNEDL